LGFSFCAKKALSELISFFCKAVSAGSLIHLGMVMDCARDANARLIKTHNRTNRVDLINIGKAFSGTVPKLRKFVDNS
jgi:hypothetical protein